MKLSLLVLSAGSGQGKLIPIGTTQFLIGRDPQCHLRPASPLISKRHCALLVRGDKVFLRDFDSTNGTFVNDQPVKGEVELHADDQLKVGPLVFGVKLETTPPVDKPTPMPPTKPQGLAAKTPAPPTKAPVPAAKTPPPPARQEAPEPKKAPVAGPGASHDDDSAAEMLLSLGDDSEPTSTSGNPIDIPDGSTIMDVPSPLAAQEGGKPGNTKGGAAKKSGDTSGAAKAILDKYMKRPRS